MTTRTTPTPPPALSPFGDPTTGGQAPSMWQDAALVFRREFFTRIRSSMFLATLGFALLAMVGGILFIAATESDRDIVGLVGAQPAGIAEALPQLTADAGFGTVDVETFASREELEAAILSGRVRVGVIDGEELVVETRDGTLPNFLALVWEDARMDDVIDGPLLDPEQRQAVVDAGSTLPITELEPDPESSAKRGVAVALVILLFMTIQLVGGMLLMSITEEKGNNIVELLLSSMSSRSLLLGKLAANGLLGLIQVATLIGAAIVAVNLADLADLPTIPPALLLVALVWFIIGFAFFGVLIAAGASLAPSPEDAQSVIMPVFVVLFLGYLASFYVTANPDGVVSRVVSLVPFVSPFVMPSRYLDGDLPLWEHALALGIAAVALVVVLRVGARIYTRSVIHTDRKLGWLEAFRAEPVR